MKGLRTLLFVLLGATMLAGDAAVRLPIADTSPLGSAVQNTGTVTVSEATVSGERLYSYTDNWTVRNVSRKAVVALVETMLLRFSNGQSLQRTLQWEGFFQPEVIEPGESLPQTTHDPAIEFHAGGKNGLSYKSTCEVVLRWVEFADGTTAGDPNYAEGLLRNRAATWKLLTALHDVYRTQGLEEFRQQLLSRVQPAEVDGFLEHLRRIHKEGGPEAAVSRLELHLKTAEQRTAAFGK